jgi:hypothetical protein
MAVRGFLDVNKTVSPPKLKIIDFRAVIHQYKKDNY